MEQLSFEDKIFDDVDYSERYLSPTEYSECQFINCNFSKADLSNSDFVDCVFKGCNFSLAVMINTGLKHCSFEACKLVGIDFSKCSNFLFEVSFDNCPLDYSSFYQKKLKNVIFKDCPIKDADFTEADLTMARFQQCDLANTTFFMSNLEKTDFVTARNYHFEPAQNKIKKTRLSREGALGLLSGFDLIIE